MEHPMTNGWFIGLPAILGKMETLHIEEHAVAKFDPSHKPFDFAKTRKAGALKNSAASSSSSRKWPDTVWHSSASTKAWERLGASNSWRHLTPRSEPLTFGHVCRISRWLWVFHLVFRCTLLMFWYVLFIFFKFVEFSTCKAVLDASTLVTTLCLLAHFWKGTISSISQRIRRVAMFSMLTSMIKLRMQLVTHIATYCHIVPQSATECH